MAFEDDHITAGLGIGLAKMSRTVAMSCWLPPTMIVAVDGDTLTRLAVGAVTVTATVVDMVDVVKLPFPGAVAVTVMAALPGATAVMTPIGDTVATPGVLVPYVTLASGALGGCETVVISDCVRPVWRLTVIGVTVRPLIDGGIEPTVIVAVPETPSTVAVTMAVPIIIPVTSPV